MGVDYSFARPSPASIRAAGYTFASRYVSDSSAKNITHSEAQSLVAAGVDVVANWENDGNQEIMNGFASGVHAAQVGSALALAAGMRATRPLYFSIDFDAQPYQQGSVNAFMDGAASVLGRHRVGAYGSYGVIKRLFDAGKITFGWQTYAWSYGNWDPRAQVRQINNSAACGGRCDIDQAIATDFGQWNLVRPSNPYVVFRPSDATWRFRGLAASNYGVATDVPVAGDYTGEGKYDIALWRPSTGTWYVPGLNLGALGASTDVPVQADYNGDGKTDVAVWRPSTGTWYLKGIATVAYGEPGDIPAPGDYNGDGKDDIAVWRPSTGTWYVRGIETVVHGQAGDIPVPGDFDGDGKTELAVWRPSNGTWYIRGAASVAYGQLGDIPIPGDFDGDGKTDLAVYRPSNGTWYVRGLPTLQWGIPGDIPAGTWLSRINLWRLKRVAQPLPIIKCPANITGQATGALGGKVTYAAAMATDVLTRPVLTYSTVSGAVFPLGPTTVTATAKDAYDGSASCTFTVTVKDTVAPKLTCPADQSLVTLDPNGTPAAYAAQAGDPVTPPTLRYEPAVGSVLPLGTTTVQVTATDAAGNASSCSFQVDVAFTGLPTVTCPADVTEAAESPDGVTVEYEPAVAFNPAGSADVAYSQQSSTVFPIGTTSVTATVADQSGQHASCTFQVTVSPFTAPSNPDGGRANEGNGPNLKRTGGCSAAGGMGVAGWAVAALALLRRRKIETRILAVTMLMTAGCGKDLTAIDGNPTPDETTVESELVTSGVRLAPANMSPQQQYQFYLRFMAAHTNLAQIAGQPIVLAIRGVDIGNNLHGTTSANAYDDVLLILYNGVARVVPGATHPTQKSTSTFYETYGRVGLLDENLLYAGIPNGNHQGAYSWYLKRVDANSRATSNDHLPVVYDNNYDGIYSAAEVALAGQQGQIATEVLLHVGPDSVACQMYRPSEISAFIPLIGKTIYYMVVQAGGKAAAYTPNPYAVFRPSDASWRARGLAATPYGAATDIPVPGDYKGDGTYDIALWRPSTGTWYVPGLTLGALGISTDVPVQSDYNGDGKTDPAVWRASNGTWYIKGPRWPTGRRAIFRFRATTTETFGRISRSGGPRTAPGTCAASRPWRWAPRATSRRELG